MGTLRGTLVALLCAILTSGIGGCAAGDDNKVTGDRPEEGAKDDTNDASTGSKAEDAQVPESLSLRLVPDTAELVVTGMGAPPEQAFVAELVSTGEKVKARFQVASDLISVDEQGVVGARGIVGGIATLTARYGDLVAEVTVTVRVDLRDDASTQNVPPTQVTALDGTPTPDPGLNTVPANPTKILYPYDGTVMPRGLTAPIVQFSAGSLPPQDIKVSLETDGFRWVSYAHVDSPSTPRVSLPQNIWDAALLTAKGKRVRLSVVKAVDGIAYGPAHVEAIAADGTLKGAVYYMTYDAESVGLWSVRPGDAQPAKHIVKGCVVCHSASSNGLRLSTGADLAAEAPRSGVYNVSANGDATQLTGAPSDFGGDSRGLSFATFTPDGRYVMRSQNDFWGGLNQRAFFIDDANKALSEANVVGLGAGVSAYLPAFSHDGKRFAFTNGAGEAAPVGTTSRSLSVMDVAIDDSAGPFGTLTFTNRKVVHDSGAGGAVLKFATFMPDPSLLAFQEGESYLSAYNEMLPTWGPDSNYRTATGRLAMVHVDSKVYTRLERLNRGQVESDANRNYEPFALPVSAGGYYWIVFTSIREYGNTYTGEGVRKQLWVAAISPNAPPGQDPSHPPFYLPNQSETANERGFWALSPCLSDGASCTGGDECCNGFCRPADPQMPELGNVCMPPDDGMCADLHERCTAAADCCQAAMGALCIAGYCDIPAPL